MSRQRFNTMRLASALGAAWAMQTEPEKPRDRSSFDTNALRDDEARIAAAQSKRERKRRKRLEQKKRMEGKCDE